MGLLKTLAANRRTFPLLHELTTRVNGNGVHTEPVGYVCPVEEKKTITLKGAIQKLEDLRKDYGLYLDGMKVLSVEKREHLPKIVLDEKVRVIEPGPVVSISVPINKSYKVLSFIREKFWDKGNGIPVVFLPDNYACPSIDKSNADYLKIVGMEQKARAASQAKI